MIPKRPPLTLSTPSLTRLAITASAAAMLSLASCTSAPDSPAQATESLTTEQSAAHNNNAILAKLATRAWVDLMGSQDNCGQPFDYFPGGGMLSTYCHLMEFATFHQIETIWGKPIFLKGPHQNGQLTHDSKTSFGHYDPDFVRGIANWAIPAAQNEAFKQATHNTYRNGLQPLARTYWATYQKLKANPDYWKAQQAEINEHLEDAGMPDYYYEKYFVFMNPEFIDNRDAPIDYFYERGFDGNYDGNIVKSAVGFWIRRGIDGTAEDFAQGLRQLLEVYDPTFLADHTPFTAQAPPT